MVAFSGHENTQIWNVVLILKIICHTEAPWDWLWTSSAEENNLHSWSYLTKKCFPLYTRWTPRNSFHVLSPYRAMYERLTSQGIRMVSWKILQQFVIKLFKSKVLLLCVIGASSISSLYTLFLVYIDSSLHNKAKVWQLFIANRFFLFLFICFHMFIGV
jgi:hypothetical protein